MNNSIATGPHCNVGSRSTLISAKQRPCERQIQRPMSASSSLALTVLQNPLSQPLLQKPPVLHIIFYNPRIQKTQVQTAALYERWITGKLKADVTAAILKHNADIKNIKL